MYKLSVSEAVVCMSNEKKKRQAADPANQMAQLLSLAAQANVPLEYLQQQAVYNRGYQQPHHQQHHQYHPHPQQQQLQSSQPFNYSIANPAQLLAQSQPQPQLNQVQNLLSAFTSNQSLLNNLNLLTQQQPQQQHLKK
jgi:hypothetical protein